MVKSFLHRFWSEHWNIASVIAFIVGGKLNQYSTRGWETTYTIAQNAHHDEFTAQNLLVACIPPSSRLRKSETFRERANFLAKLHRLLKFCNVRRQALSLHSQQKLFIVDLSKSKRVSLWIPSPIWMFAHWSSIYRGTHFVRPKLPSITHSADNKPFWL